MEYEKKYKDYSISLAIIAIWTMVGGIAQCDSARNLDSIRHEMRILQYK